MTKLFWKITLIRKNLGVTITSGIYAKDKEAALDWVYGAYGKENVEILKVE